MKRIITGWFLIMLMAVFTVTAHSSLRYCLCNNAVVLGDCLRDQTQLTPRENKQSVAEERDACRCCDANQLMESDTESIHESISCDSDCIVDILIQLDDFVIKAGGKFDTEMDSKVKVFTYGRHQNPTAQEVTLANSICPPRGSPQIFNRHSVPIYLRDSVFRL